MLWPPPPRLNADVTPGCALTIWRGISAVGRSPRSPRPVWGALRANEAQPVSRMIEGRRVEWERAAGSGSRGTPEQANAADRESAGLLSTQAVRGG